MQKGFVPIVILFGALIIVIAFIGGYLYLNKGKSAQEQQTETTYQQQTVQTPSQNSPVQITENNTLPILKEYDSKAFGRNLWLYDKNLAQGVQITSNHEILGLYGKSPDNKKVLVSTVNRVPNDNNVHEKISIVDIGSKNITRLFLSSNTTSSVNTIYWLDNNQLVYSLGRQLKMYNISAKSEDTLVDTESFNDSSVITFKVSPDRKWLVYYYSGGGLGAPAQKDSNVYSINLENRKQTRLFALSDGYFYTLNNNYVIYSKTTAEKSGIWKIDFSGLKSEMITIIPQGELINITTDSSGSKIVYKLRNYSQNSGFAELHLYNLDKQTDQMLFRAEVGDGIRDPRMSAEGNSVLFSAALDKNAPLKFTIVNLDLVTNKQATLSNDQEPSPFTAIVY